MADGRRDVLEVPAGHFASVAEEIEPARAGVVTGIVSMPPSPDWYGGATSAQELAQHSARAQAWMAERRDGYQRQLDRLLEDLQVAQSELESAQEEASLRMQALLHGSDPSTGASATTPTGTGSA